MEELKIIFIDRPTESLEKGLVNIIKEKQLFIDNYLEDGIEVKYSNDAVIQRLQAYEKAIEEHLSAIRLMREGKKDNEY
mgnify:CR=1 FL=1